MIEMLVGAGIWVVAYVVGYRNGRQFGADVERLKYREAYAALADGKLPPEPQVKIVEVPAKSKRASCGCASAGSWKLSSPACRAHACPECCYRYCSKSCPGRGG